MFDKLKNMFSGKKQEVIGAPVQGEVVPVSQVNDPTFSDDILGTGIAIKPSAGRVVAPTEATVAQMFDTGHACSLVTAGGAELLIHVGLDTVKLKGEHYTIHAKDGDKVQAGDLLMEFDMDAVAAAGYDTITPIVLMNPGDFSNVELKPGQTADELAPIMILEKE